MTPDKAQQLGNDLACLAASISEIAEEIKAMYDFDRDANDRCDEPEPQEAAPEPEPPKTKAPTLEEVRGVLADKASGGHREAVQALIQKHGAKKLSDITPSEFEALIKEARAIK
jgi:hypothetical protein